MCYNSPKVIFYIKLLQFYTKPGPCPEEEEIYYFQMWMEASVTFSYDENGGVEVMFLKV